ncbi:hypothetical protein Tco_1578962, partial [Tanacetum coccineum]
SAGDALIRRKQETGKGIEEIKDSPPPTPIRSPNTHISLISSDKETLQELTVTAQDSPSSSNKGNAGNEGTDHTPSSSTPSSVGFMLMSYEYLYG